MDLVSSLCALQEALPSSEEDENNIQNVRADHRRQHEAMAVTEEEFQHHVHHM